MASLPWGLRLYSSGLGYNHHHNLHHHMGLALMSAGIGTIVLSCDSRKALFESLLGVAIQTRVL